MLEGEEMSKEVMQQALEALEASIDVPCYGGHPRQEAAATALREALAEQPAYRAVKTFHEGKPVYVAEQPAQQEPVAWMVYTLDGKSVFVTDNPADFTPDHRALPLYTSPPAQRKPLTDEQIERACVPLGAAMLSFTEVARAIEAAHGIKEST
jgi:hypothetical protein